MVRLNKIYTRTGDKGDTGLTDGSRVPKTSTLIAAIGDVDEANSAIGLAALHAGPGAMGSALAALQNDLFDLGADLSTPGPDFDMPAALRIVRSQIDRLEEEIDAMTARLAPLTSFILPGGTPLAAHLHLSRAIARRAERTALAAHAVSALNPRALIYLNRVSDWLFVAARVANDEGRADVCWVPGASR